MRQPLASPIFIDETWQMSIGERAAIEGLLREIRPQLAIEIGTAEGGALRRIAEHSQEVHAFDLVPSPLRHERVTFHIGDSHELLPQVLAEFAEAGRNVDFVLVDGDHTAEGVRRDVQDLLDSPAVANAVVLVHDTANEEVRRGLDAVAFGAWPKVAHVDLDCVPGWIFQEESLRYELWGGLGAILVDATRDAYAGGDPVQQRAFPAAPLLAAGRDELVREAEEAARAKRAAAARADGDADDGDAEQEDPEQELARLRAELAHQQRVQRDLEASISWRLTAPLRTAKQRLGRRSAA